MFGMFKRKREEKRRHLEEIRSKNEKKLLAGEKLLQNMRKIGAQSNFLVTATLFINNEFLCFCDQNSSILDKNKVVGLYVSPEEKAFWLSFFVICLAAQPELSGKKPKNLLDDSLPIADRVFGSYRTKLFSVQREAAQKRMSDGSLKFNQDITEKTGAPLLGATQQGLQLVGQQLAIGFASGRLENAEQCALKVVERLKADDSRPYEPFYSDVATNYCADYDYDQLEALFRGALDEWVSVAEAALIQAFDFSLSD